jgi:RNA polymerase sigma-70 factor (ECF subfamily)
MTDWPAVVRDHGPLVWRTAYRLLADHADAADCFQRTFLAAVELAARQPVRCWPAVLRRLSTARALEQLRQRYRRPVALAAEPPTLADPLDAASAGELADALRRALAALDPLQAQVICLVCLDGRSNADAAADLGLTANHVGVLLHRARQALRLQLAAFDPAAGAPSHE